MARPVHPLVRFRSLSLTACLRFRSKDDSTAAPPAGGDANISDKITRTRGVPTAQAALNATLCSFIFKRGVSPFNRNLTPGITGAHEPPIPSKFSMKGSLDARPVYPLVRLRPSDSTIFLLRE